MKYVNNATGSIKTFKDQFQSARLRFVEDTNKLYRFEGSDIRYAEGHDMASEQPLLTCDWKTGSDWGTDDPPIVKREGEKLTLAQIEEDILEKARDNDPVIHGNVNILADNIVKSASIISSKVDGHTVYEVQMELDCAVANADEASQLMLKNANSVSLVMEPKTINWVQDENGKGPVITYQIWDNGLLKYYSMDETWEGKIQVLLISSYDGKATASQQVWYSYSAADTSMTEKLAMLEEAKNLKG